MYRIDFWTLWEKARVGCSERTSLKQVYYRGWNRSSAQVGCMRQVLRAGALGRPRGMGWGGKWEGGSGWGTPVNPWLIHVNVWQKSLQYCKVISFQLIKINEKKSLFSFSLLSAISVLSSTYLRLLIFLQAILIPACASSSLAFCMMYSTYKLNKQGDNIYSLDILLYPIWNKSVPCPVLLLL